MAKRRLVFSPLLILPLILIGVPLVLLTYESRRTGLSYADVVARVARQAQAGSAPQATARLPKGEKIDFFEPRPIGDTPHEKSTIAHVAIYDLDQDGLKDVLVCDVLHRRVTWIRQHPADVYTERQIGDEVAGAPPLVD